MTDKQQLSPEWFEARRGRITGSMVGAILDIAPYMTRDEALRTMVRDANGVDSEFIPNVTTQHHDNNRSGAIWEYELETGKTVKPEFFEGIEDWAGEINLDVADGVIVEVYTPYALRANPSPKFKSAIDMPHRYAKMQFNMYVSGIHKTDMYQWTPHGTALETVESDQQWLDENLPLLRQFYAFYLSELDNTDHLEPLRKEINTDATKLLLDEYDQLNDAIDQAKERLDEVKAAIIDATGDRDALMWGRKVTKVEREGSVSYAKVVKDHAKGVDLEPYRGQGSKTWKIT